jgi:NitT/TauT family transport system substrate-binding protein
LVLRRHFVFTIILLVFAVALAGCHGRQAAATGGLTPVRLQVDWYPQPEQGGYYAAQLNGDYKAEGLDATILPLPQYGSVAPLVSSGNAEFGLGSSDQILEWDSNGLPLVAIAATMQHDPQAIMVHEGSPIHDFKDLEGHTIAAQTGATWIKYVIERYRLQNVRQIPTTLSVANFLADPGYVQQVFVTSEPFFAKQAGAQVRTLPISASGYDPYRVCFTTREFAAAHPDVAARFVRASMRGWNEYLRDPGPTDAHLLELNPALNAAQESYTAAALRDGGFVTGGDASGAQTGHMNAARWEAMDEQLKELGILHGPVDVNAAYTLKFLP